MRYLFLLFLIFLFTSATFAQDAKIGLMYGRIGFGVSQFWYQHHYLETHTGDSTLYAYDNEGKKSTHAGLSLHAEGGYCFARPFRLGLYTRARVYLENSTQLPGIYFWLCLGPSVEYYFRENLALFGRLHYFFDTQFRDAERHFAWGGGFGIRYLPAEIQRCGISLSAEYAGTRGEFLRYAQIETSVVPIKIDQTIRNSGFLLEFALSLEL
jgi:hypothetical protein